MTKRESPFACVMDAIEPSARGPHLENAKRLFASVTEVKELADGYAFRLPAELLLDVARFVELERLCCPFFGFFIEVESEGGEVILRLTGREGVKDFVKAEVNEILDLQFSTLSYWQDSV
jgi:hypothetical protein